MPVYTTPKADEPWVQPSRDSAPSSDIWIENLNHLNTTAAELRANIITVDNPSAATNALKEQVENSAVIRPKRVVLTGWTTIVRSVPFVRTNFNYSRDLPLELRGMIWEHAMRCERYGGQVRAKIGDPYKEAQVFEDPVEIRQEFAWGRVPNTRLPGFLPAVCRTSQGLQTEIVDVFIRNSTFFVCSFNDNRFMQEWLNNVPNGFSSVNSLHFEFFSCFPPNHAQNADLELAVKCTGLTDLTIAFHTSNLLVKNYSEDSDDDSDEFFPRNTKEIWAYYKLDRLLACQMLKRVSIRRKGYADEVAAAVLTALAEMVEENFKSQAGKTVVVKVI